MTSDREYLVGYARPPVETQFKKGVSGNPKGRPKKKSLSLAARIRQALDVKVQTSSGQKSAEEEIINRRVISALKGDVSEAIALLELAAPFQSKLKKPEPEVTFLGVLPGHEELYREYFPVGDDDDGG